MCFECGMEKKLKKTYKDSNKRSLVCSLALDYGVFEYLDRVRFADDQRSLLDEVDVISSS